MLDFRFCQAVAPIGGSGSCARTSSTHEPITEMCLPGIFHCGSSKVIEVTNDVLAIPCPDSIPGCVRVARSKPIQSAPQNLGSTSTTYDAKQSHGDEAP